MDCLYLDNNSTTPLLPAVADAMRPYLEGVAGNPSSAHRLGRQARKALETAREQIASLLGAFPDEVIFTSGATEANNLGVLSSQLSVVGEQKVVASRIEHPSVVEPLLALERSGAAVSWLPVDAAGVVGVEGIEAHLRDEAALVALMLANHETGAIQPVRRVVEVCGAVRVHCDAVQAVGKIAVCFRELGVATLSLSAHKFHGPKGVGALLVRRGVRLTPLMHGGHQQRGLRPGTEPVAHIVGLAAALAIAEEEREARWAKVGELRKCFLAGLREVTPILNGPAESGMPHTLNLSFPGLKADLLLMALDLAGVCCSTGSACSSGSLLPSPVLQAMNVPDDRLRSALRFSLSALLSVAEVEEAAVRICRVVKRLRQGTPPA